MTRWDDVSPGRTGDAYALAFDRLAASGADVHGEAALVAALAGPPPARVLDAGCGTGRVAMRLAELGYDCVGADLDPSMLAVARARAPQLTWVQTDLATLDLVPAGVDHVFDVVVAAGNVIPLVAPGTESDVVSALAQQLGTGGLLVAGFGLDAAHLPLPEATITLDDYDTWCAAAGLELTGRYSTWAGAQFDGGGYAVSIHTRR
jgi:SAM-dependent methyltransferase